MIVEFTAYLLILTFGFGVTVEEPVVLSERLPNSLSVGELVPLPKLLPEMELLGLHEADGEGEGEAKRERSGR